MSIRVFPTARPPVRRDLALPLALASTLLVLATHAALIALALPFAFTFRVPEISISYLCKVGVYTPQMALYKGFERFASWRTTHGTANRPEIRAHDADHKTPDQRTGRAPATATNPHQ